MYGWNFYTKTLVSETTSVPSGHVWGTAYGVNQTTSTHLPSSPFPILNLLLIATSPKGSAMVVAGDPTGKTGYTVYALSLQGGSLSILSQLDVNTGDTLPQLGTF